jgi:hypothetical protein
MKEEFEYEGFMSLSAQEFFEGNTIREERDGCSTIGSFIRLSSGKTHLPSKGDKFIKNEDGGITLQYRIDEEDDYSKILKASMVPKEYFDFISEPVVKDLTYWKNNCEENYMTTPISVLRYISELEKSLNIGDDGQTESVYSEGEVIKLVDRVFHMYASSHRHDAREWLVEQFKKK